MVIVIVIVRFEIQVPELALALQIGLRTPFCSFWCIEVYLLIAGLVMHAVWGMEMIVGVPGLPGEMVVVILLGGMAAVMAVGADVVTTAGEADMSVVVVCSGSRSIVFFGLLLIVCIGGGRDFGGGRGGGDRGDGGRGGFGSDRDRGGGRGGGGGGRGHGGPSIPISSGPPLPESVPIPKSGAETALVSTLLSSKICPCN